MYNVGFTPDGNADMARLSPPVAQRVLKKLRWLAENFDAIRQYADIGNYQTVAPIIHLRYNPTKNGH